MWLKPNSFANDEAIHSEVFKNAKASLREEIKFCFRTRNSIRVLNQSVMSAFGAKAGVSQAA